MKAVTTTTNLVQLLELGGFSNKTVTLEEFSAWQRLVARQTDYAIGDVVMFILSGVLDGCQVEVEKTAIVSALRLAADDKTRFIEYGLTLDLPDVYHYGEQPKWWRRAENLKPVSSRLKERVI